VTRCLSGPLPGVGERCRERDLFLPPLKGHRLAYTVAPAPERQGVGPRLRETGVTSPVPGSKKIAAFGRAFPAHKTASDESANTPTAALKRTIRNLGGIVRPKALAVLELITSSNSVQKAAMQTNLSAQEFAGKLLGIYTGGMQTKLIDIGYQTGLFEAAVEGPATSDELAARAGLDERYVREWLGAMATSGIFLYDAASGRYRLPQEHAVSLTGTAARNVSPMSGVIDHFGKHLSSLVKCSSAASASR
jgi:hypothetical protein